VTKAPCKNPKNSNGKGVSRVYLGGVVRFWGGGKQCPSQKRIASPGQSGGGSWPEGGKGEVEKKQRGGGRGRKRRRETLTSSLEIG